MAHSASESDRSRSPPRKEEAPPDHNTCLYIGNIDKRVTEDKLREAFSGLGELQYCYIVYEPQSGSGSFRGEPKQSRGYGFAKYKREGDAQIARDKMQGLDLNGRRINVEVSKRNRPREPTPGRYLGKKRASPPRRSRRYRDSYSRSRDHSRSRSRRSRSSSRSYRRHRHGRHHEKRRHSRRYRSRERSESYRKHRSSYSRSPRR